MNKRTVLLMGITLVLVLCLGQPAVAKDKKVIDQDVAMALGKLDQEVPGATQMIKDAKGALICPNLRKVGFGLGVSGGACALQVAGQPVDYFRSTGVSFGLTAGVQSNGLALVFNSQEELDKFRKGNRKWEAGVDASVAVAKKGASGALDTTTASADVVAIPFDQKGLMADMSVAGSTFKKIDPTDFDGLLYTFVAAAEIDDSRSRDTTANLRIAIDQWNTEEERQLAIATLRDKGAAAAVTEMDKWEAPGRVSQPGDKAIPLLFAYQTKNDDGTYKVILGTKEPIGFGVARQQVEKSENNYSIIELDLNDQGVGTGVLNQGSEFGFDQKRDVVTIEKVNVAPTRLTSVSAKKS